jgi:hypothetical protein
MHTIINNLTALQIHGKDESEYFQSIVSNINDGNDYTFVFSCWDSPLGNIPEGSIVFSTSDEKHQQPISDHLQKNVSFVFKNYYPNGGAVDARVFPLPLGYLTGFSGNDSVPINDRPFDYSFSGTINMSGREKMYQQLQHRQNDGRQKFCQITNGWGKGLNMNEYSQLLSSTKIALCPSGYISKESFRIFEAARCGCVLLVDTIPTNLWYYDGFPGIIIEDWSNLSVIEELLSDPNKLCEISKQTSDWYHRCISPKAVANYVTHKMKEFHP